MLYFPGQHRIWEGWGGRGIPGQGRWTEDRAGGRRARSKRQGLDQQLCLYQTSPLEQPGATSSCSHLFQLWPLPEVAYWGSCSTIVGNRMSYPFCDSIAEALIVVLDTAQVRTACMFQHWVFSSLWSILCSRKDLVSSTLLKRLIILI